MFDIGVKLGLVTPEGEGMRRLRVLRRGCLEEYFDLRERRKLYNEDIHNLYCSRNITRIMK
jgi:hypothetical protein